MGISIAVAAGGALLVDRLWSWRRPIAVIVALGLPAFAAREAVEAGDWPRPGFDLPPYDGVAALASHPRSGVVPPCRPPDRGTSTSSGWSFSFSTGVRSPGISTCPTLHPTRPPPCLSPVLSLQWASEATPASEPAPRFTEADQARLRDQGIAFVTVYWRELDPTRQAALYEALTETLGPPVASQPRLWTAWLLDAT